MADPADEPDRHPAQEALAQALQAAESARAQGHSFATALALTQAGHALLVLNRPEEALEHLDEAAGFLDLLRADGQHEHMRMLSMASLSLAPPGENLGDLDTLEAWIRVGQAGAFEQLGRIVEAHQAVEGARPFARGWRRRDLRKALDAIADRLARAEGVGPGALAASGRAAQDESLSEEERREARYEHMVLLVDNGRFDDAIKAALLMLRDTDDDPSLQARVRQVLGAALSGAGRDDDALLTLRQAFDEFCTLGEDRAVTLAGPGLSARLAQAGRSDEAVDVLRRSIEAARSLQTRGAGDDALLADLLGALATAIDESGDTAAAVTAFAEAVDAAEAVGDPIRVADARHGEAIARSRSGDADDAVEALALLDAARSGYEAVGLTDRVAGCQHEAAALLARLGSLDAAQARYRSAADTYAAIPDVLAADIAPARDDVHYNLRVLQVLIDGGESHAPPDAFTSGGHQMAFGSGSSLE